MILEKLKELGIELDEKSSTFGAYVPSRVSGSLLFVSGQLPVENGKLKYTGKAGNELDVDQGYDAAKVAAINCISVIKSEIGDFRNLKKIVKVEGYVASAPGFNRQADVVNGASDLLFDVFGDIGTHARAAVGVSELPLNSPVEIALIAEISTEYSY